MSILESRQLQETQQRQKGHKDKERNERGKKKNSEKKPEGGFVGISGLSLRGMKSSCRANTIGKFCKNKPEGLEIWVVRVRRRAKWGSAMRKSQCLATVLKWMSDLMGSRTRISFKRSSSVATVSADDG
ncbi:hypothetical protein LOK49_LG01G01217 [Camellia lanceoleosa]|uniref:Uncharacterized protein n=1 Tax=Camellia lanceoleosa TaxID=1840588 RepID=A0ACC0J378_9ERIC|nr:hypothetical protein LOK49_LG01G01217 [Camellia lanceoleosa]